MPGPPVVGDPAGGDPAGGDARRVFPFDGSACSGFASLASSCFCTSADVSDCFASARSLGFATVEESYSVAPGDLDGDGYVDLAFDASVLLNETVP